MVALLGMGLGLSCLRAPLPGLDSETVLFLDVTVVPMDTERLLPPQTVVTHNGKILAIGTSSDTKVPKGARLVDGRGKYLMPGLIDMDVHLSDPAFLKLLVAYGVTTVRNMWGSPERLLLRDQIAHGQLLGPTIFMSGPPLDGVPPSSPDAVGIGSEEDAERVVRAQQEAGYDYIKVYDGLSRKAYRAVIAAAKRYHLRVVGHVPTAVGLSGALLAGQASIEHLAGFAEVLETADSPLRGRYDPFISLSGVRFAYADADRIASITSATRNAAAWNCVTLVLRKKVLELAQGQDLSARPEMRFVPPAQRKAWDEWKAKQGKRLVARDLERAQEMRLRLTKALRDSGDRLLLGTDAPTAFNIPGLSVHEELSSLVEAGLTPFEALAAGTRDAAEFLGGIAEFGTVKVGKRADLLLVDGNPLQDVSNVRHLAGVVLGGHWMPAEELHELLEGLAKSYQPATQRSK